MNPREELLTQARGLHLRSWGAAKLKWAMEFAQDECFLDSLLVALCSNPLLSPEQFIAVVDHCGVSRASLQSTLLERTMLADSIVASSKHETNCPARSSPPPQEEKQHTDDDGSDMLTTAQIQAASLFLAALPGASAFENAVRRLMDSADPDPHEDAAAAARVPTTLRAHILSIVLSQPGDRFSPEFAAELCERSFPFFRNYMQNVLPLMDAQQQVRRLAAVRSRLALLQAL